MIINYKTKNPIRTEPTSNDMWYVPHNGYYFYRYNNNSGSNYPTVPLIIKFKGQSNNTAFANKFNYRWSNIVR
jgi:hypothetical protein